MWNVYKTSWKNSKRNKETGVLSLVYKNELNEAYFVHDAAYSDSKDLVTQTISDEILKDRAYEITVNSKYDG